MAGIERQSGSNAIEKGLKVWGWTEVIAGVGLVAFATPALIGLLAIGSGGAKLAIIEMQKRKKQNTGS